jgi:hypothetical protein
VATGAGVVAAREPPAPPLDPLQQAVVDSLTVRRLETPSDLLDAAVRTADLEADAVACDYVRRLRAAVAAADEAARPGLLADLGDAVGGASLARLERRLASREPAVREIVAAIRAAVDLRHRDPARLAAAAAALRDPSARVRADAAATLARGREDALPAVVDLLATTDPDGERARGIAARLVRDLGADARQPLLAWLGSDDTDHWPGVIEALRACGAGDVAVHLVAPALAADSPPEARRAAVRGLGGRPPEPAAAAALVAERLDRVLTPAGVPHVDAICPEPAAEPNPRDGTVERFVWDDEQRRLVRLNLPPRTARLQEALHLARDLAAIDTRDPQAVRLVLLTRLEAMLVAAGEPARALESLDPVRLRAALEGPDGFDPAGAADVLDLAVTRGLWEAAAGAAAALEPPPGRSSAPLPPAVRKALVRALAVPDPAVQFQAARTLALAAGDPPWAGSSRMVEVLVHAATSTGDDVAIVAHPDLEVAQSLAAGVSRFGYRPVIARSGRDCLLAARGSADTVLVLVAARLPRPAAFETVQLLRDQGLGAVPPVLVVVAPRDDGGRGCFLTQLLLRLRDLDCVAVVDRLDSFFAPVAEGTGAGGPRPARFPEALTQLAGPRSIDPAARAAARAARRGRAREAMALLAAIGRRGGDVSAALDAARLAAAGGPAADPAVADLHDPAVMLLGAIGRPTAQAALLQEVDRAELPPAARQLAIAAFAASVERHGILLKCREIGDVVTRYTHVADAGTRRASATVLDVLGTPRDQLPPTSADAPPARPHR